MDDQLARVREVENGTDRVVVVERTLSGITTAVKDMVEGVKSSASERVQHDGANGADELAHILLQSIGDA